jgi:hypothetical protein
VLAANVPAGEVGIGKSPPRGRNPIESSFRSYGINV